MSKRSNRYVYFFGGGRADGNKEMKDLLGGKGANLAEMTNAGVPVPPGFTVTTEACLLFSRTGKVPATVGTQMKAALAKVEKLTGSRFGDPSNPLLVSVRSGSKFSMPGMMDTILNLGLNEDTVNGLIERAGVARFAYDAYRRFVAMFGNVVLGLDKDLFERELSAMKRDSSATSDTDLDADDLRELTSAFRRIVSERTGHDFPDDPWEQLLLARDAVFSSWNNERARIYRRQEGIPDDLGTAVNVQTMVFGNMGETSCTGVGFTRNPATGEKEFYGEYLVNAQGEDVVAGVRTPKPITELHDEMPAVYKQLVGVTRALEKHYRDVQDFEFTVQQGTLYMLQTRSGKRTGLAALRISLDMVDERLISKEEAVSRMNPALFEQLFHPQIDPAAPRDVIAAGLAASPGGAVGRVVFTSEHAEEWSARGEKVVLVREETNPDDIGGMLASQGVLTMRGGMTSHAAVVARQFGTPAVVGCGAVHVDAAERSFLAGGRVVSEGDWITLDGTSGEVLSGQMPLVEADPSSEGIARFLKWTDSYRRLKVRTNADTPEDSERAVQFGAEGIGLCRTEHMFFAEERVPIVREMILAETPEQRKAALDRLLPLQREDFVGIFRAMGTRPVTIRTLDPPLHEFLPTGAEMHHEIERMKAEGAPGAQIEKTRAMLARADDLRESNPMLGHRGCRLGITYPEITEMQARAIFEAACRVHREGVRCRPEVMIPLVGHVGELANQRRVVVEAAEAVFSEQGMTVPYHVGTMIEVPRGAITADQIAREADFFSFGTNDLTQMVFGFSRDDAGTFLHYYIDTAKILPNDPFVTIDRDGVGLLVHHAVLKGREAKPGLKIGICGEHGGDPKSVMFCHEIGLDYVSCSPLRVPIARLAAAQAAIEEKRFKVTAPSRKKRTPRAKSARRES
jgi:pyruvate,orthophosphate dikinase